MRKYRVYYRVYQSKSILSIIVEAKDKTTAINKALDTMFYKGTPIIPTGYVTLVGKQTPF